jgi:hypothetical protein
MTELFGRDCIRAISTHAKFILARNDDWNVVVRTSMNLNENPRFENIEISDDPAFCGFMFEIADYIFTAVPEGKNQSAMPKIPESYPFLPVQAEIMDYESMKVPKVTHAV